MSLMLWHKPTKRIYVGMSGSGKTLSANRFILQSNYNWYFIFDHDRQFSQRNRLKPAMSPAEILSQFPSQFIVFDPSEIFDDECEAFEWFCKYVYRMSEHLKGTKLLYCDELQDIVPTNRIPKAVRKVFVSGRNRGLDFVGCGLQYNQIHNAIRGQATHTIAFATDEKLALNELVAKGFRAEDVASLKPGEFIEREKSTGRQVRGKIF
jgi:hypothetical protein